MLPTRPRLTLRSIRSSCTTPDPVTATRVSCGVTLIRISSVTQFLEELAGLVERQPHDARVAAAQLHDEACRASLDGIGAGLVVGLAGGDVLRDLFGRELLELHFRARYRRVYPVVAHQRYSGEDLVAPPGKRRQHGGGFLAVGGLAEDAAVESHRGVCGEHRRERQIAQAQQPPAGLRLGARYALDV